MKTYFYLQIKRILKVFPFILTVSVALFLGLVIVMSSIVTGFSDPADHQKVRVGITGDVDSTLVNYAIAAIESMDESSYSVEFVSLSMKNAKKQLSRGEISAYVVVPQEFIDKAMYGELTPITFVTTEGADGIVPMFKNELSKLVTNLLVYSQKGSYALSDALDNNGYESISNEQLNIIAVDYVKLILKRNEIYTLEELGSNNSLNTPQYFASGLAVFFLLLMSLPFVIIYSGKDRSFKNLLLSRGYKQNKILLCDYAVHLLSMFTLCFVIIITMIVSANFLPYEIADVLTIGFAFKLLLTLIPTIVMVSALNILFFELCDSIVSSTLLHFFVSLCLCYISGCLYPIYAFPDVIIAISKILPTNMARVTISTAFAKSNIALELFGMLIYSVLFILSAYAIRQYKTNGKRRVKHAKSN